MSTNASVVVESEPSWTIWHISEWDEYTLTYTSKQVAVWGDVFDYEQYYGLTQVTISEIGEG